VQFNKLRLVGFKSFVDPTELIIRDGLTGLVGPNGCGKSNLLEALRWVMGENRPTAMRGGGMEDVIFSGAATRPARNYAEVSLMIDNRDRCAPPAFNGSDCIDVVRRITRDAGSAYKTNGKEARARDVQMLFADASTGAHSPALVRQGQISELINARPGARRHVLEEAAGISGLYQRRHEAELKLTGAEMNLSRIMDVVEQLDGQLSQLARQARQAARYRTILEDLRCSEGLLLYRRWREADGVFAGARERLAEAAKFAAQGQIDAARAFSLRENLESKVPPLREEETIAAAVLQRLLVERDTLQSREDAARDTSETLQNRIAQLTRDIVREETLNRDADETIKRLERELVQILKAVEGHDACLAAAAADARAAAAVLQNQEAELDRQNEDVARLSARHQSARRRQEEAAEMLNKHQVGARSAEQAVTAAEIGLRQVEERIGHISESHRVAQEAAVKAETRLIEAETARVAAQTADSEARAAMSEAKGEAGALKAEVAALERVIARDRADATQLIDEVRADKGYEAALGAALADDLKAPLVDGESASGWVLLPGYSDSVPLPPGATSLAENIRAPAVLVRRLSQTGVVSQSDGARVQANLRPGQRLVSLEGDLWRWDGFRAGAGDAPSSAALRLQQENRLDDLRGMLDAAEGRATAARRRFETVRAALAEVVEADRAARTARRDADEAATAATRALSRAEADRDRLSANLETRKLARTRLSEEILAAQNALKEAASAVRELGNLHSARQTAESLKVAVEDARMAMLTKRAGFAEQRREGEVRIRRRQEITKEVSDWRHRLETAGTRIAELKERREISETEMKEARAVPQEIASKREGLSRMIDKAEARRRAASDALAAGETNLRQAVDSERTAERIASEARETCARAEALAQAARTQADTAAARIREELGTTPQKLLETLNYDPGDIPSAEVIETDIARLRRQRDALGAVNLRAEEDAREVQENRDTLMAEQTDLKAAIGKLRHGIASLNSKGRARLLAAFDEVNSNFAMLFGHLFGGGDARLALVESDDPLEAGLEIMCQPPGKKLSTLSLLSGGEQTLTALSLIFAVFLANPSPVCVLDEVDAPLDDANVTRFCDLLDEMAKRTETRFMIITHHAITMARMDRLFGVTMAEMGVSQLVSVDLGAAARMAG